MLDLTYHEPSADDLPEMTALASNWTIVRQLGGWKWPMDPEQVAKYCKPFEGKGFLWTIKDAGEWAGRIGVTGTTLGYTLPPAIHGRGIATQAVYDATKHFFAATDHAALDATTWIDNPGSHRVLLKSGFTHWYTGYEQAQARRHPVLCRHYRLTRTQWDALRASTK